MKTVYHYNTQGRFSKLEVDEGTTKLVLMHGSRFNELVPSSLTSVYADTKTYELPIIRYHRRCGSTVYIACRNDFEAQCLINNHIDLDIHAEMTCDLNEYRENSDYKKSVNDALKNKVFKTYQFVNFVPHFIVDTITPHILKVSIHM